jgi:excinuclease UvrABC nuclease subunit
VFDRRSSLPVGITFQLAALPPPHVVHAREQCLVEQLEQLERSNLEKMRDLEAKMRRAIEGEEYEACAKLRDEIAALKEQIENASPPQVRRGWRGHFHTTPLFVWIITDE